MSEEKCKNKGKENVDGKSQFMLSCVGCLVNLYHCKAIIHVCQILFLVLKKTKQKYTIPKTYNAILRVRSKTPPPLPVNQQWYEAGYA